MALVLPFRALHYNPTQIGDLTKIITPPYDVITGEDADHYRARSPYNFAHLDLLRPGETDYTHAAGRLTKWREVGILSEDPYPSYYAYQQTFEMDGQKYHRRTLMCSVELHEFSKGLIRPHEDTHGKYKADRLQQLQRTQCNMSHIFGMVKDGEGFLEGHFEKWMFHKPFLAVVDDKGVEHILWRTEHEKAAEIDAFFAERPIYIVDGHHRYESALAYAREMNALGDASHPASRTLFAISNTYDPSLIVLPTHRRVRSYNLAHVTQEAVEAKFSLSPCTEEELQKFITSTPKEPAFGLYLWGELYIATPRKWRAAEATLSAPIARLPVHWSDDVLLTNIVGITGENRSSHIDYVKNAGELLDKKSATEMIVFHARPSIEWITDVADAAKFMPQKSTFFYPKIAAGLTMRDVRRR